MSLLLKNFYNNWSEPVLTFDSKNNILYQNKSFEKIFGKLEESDYKDKLKKIEYKFYFDVCVLQSENITTYTPISNALKSEYNWGCYCVYQKNEKEFLNFTIKSINLKNWKIIYFHDITQETKAKSLEEENQKLKIQNQEFANTNTKAQSQAVKMALLNRIINTIRKSIDTKSLIETTLSELSIIFGAKKVYFLDKNFNIDYSFPNKKNDKEEKLKFSQEIQNGLLNGENLVNTELGENNVLMTRILIPVLNRDNLLGTFVIYTFEKNILQEEKELLTSISMHISSALLQAELFQEINKKNEELEKTLTELKETQLQLINSEKMASLGQLIASVAHEINTPLASISANNEIMKKLFEQYKNEMLDEINDIDEEAIKRITNIVRSLKRFVRLDEEERQSANINQELDLTLTLLKQKTKNKIKITKKYSDIPNINCYPNMLNQVFLNILMNAIQAIEKEKENGEIEIVTETKNDSLIIKISDNGAGIDESHKKKIFQAGFTTKKVGEGTGLGLAICKKIIDEHKGQINFESKKNKGTSFEIILPLI
ncbi:MAG: GHKL domain-containing protein [Cyanobacteria bacterium SIG30]|nr:GHKL domain-containing protein [Cyanobacteria bacterium SIG30]